MILTFVAVFFIALIAFSLTFTNIVGFPKYRQLKGNKRVLLPDVQSRSKVRDWFFTWLTIRRDGEEVTDNTILTEYEIQLGFYNAKVKYAIDSVCCECFSIPSIRTAGDFVEQLERHLEHHRR